MTTKKQHLLDHEHAMAHNVARLVLTKPKPPLWMIFIPVFFVFFAQKMKDHSAARDNFTANYLLSRRRALDAALRGIETSTPVDIDALTAQATDIPDSARPLYTQWMTTLVEHYQLLLRAQGGSHAAMVRSGYKTKTNYLLFCHCLNRAEHAFNQALLPSMAGDPRELERVIDKMNTASTELRRQEADSIFV